MGSAHISLTTLRLLALLVALGPAPAPAADAPDPGVFERLFARERSALEQRLSRPEAIASLAGMLALEENLPPARIEEVARALAGARNVDPLVAAHIQYRLALLESRRGDGEAALGRYRGLGLIFDFQVVGPFDAQGRGAVERAFPPEAADGGPGPGRHFPGKEREVSWREVSGVRREGALALDGLLRPDSDAVAYALTFVHSDRRRPAVLRLGSAGPVKAWVGGRVVLEKNVVREARLDQDAAAVVLERGENPILIKSVITTGAWRLFARFTDEAGRPLPDLKVVATGSGYLPKIDRSRPLARRARDLGGILRQRAEASRGSARAAAWLDYGRYLAYSRASDRDAKELERALDKAVDAGAGPSALRLLGDVAVDDDDRRRALERAVAETKDPAERALAQAQLGILARGSRRESTAFDLFRAALAGDPTCLPAALALASEEQLSGLAASGLARLDALPEGMRAVPSVRLARARLLEALGRRTEADHETAAVYETRQSDVELGLDVARAARRRGEARVALDLHARLAQHRPDLSFIATEWARLLEGRGDIPGARRVLEEAVVRLPEESTLHEELGRMLVRAEDTSAGIEQLRLALALRPQNPVLRRYLARLTADAGGGSSDPAGDWARPWIEDGRALAGAALGVGTTPAKARDGAGAVVLLDQQVVRVHSNGSAERFAQRLVHVQSEQAAREQLEFQVRYTPGTQEVEIRRAQIYRRSASGDIEVLQAAGRDDRDLSEPWYGLYYDLRADVVVFEGLKSGDVLEIQYTLSDVASESALSGYFGDIDFVSETVPRIRWRYVLIGPSGRKFHFNRPKLPGLEYKEEDRGQEILYTFAAQNIPRVVAEPGMPGWAEISPYLHISTYASWEEMARWYWRLVEDQLASDQNLARAAAEATAGATSTLDKVRAVHRFVLENTRYVALEFGIHGYKPYRVSQVLSRRFGDCKDKASLMLALLREVGVDSELVLLRTRRGGRVEVSPASLAVFDHAIVYVPALSLYLDGTAEFAGLGELPFEDQGVTALRVGPRTATLVETPVLPPASNRAVRRWQVDLDENGAARIGEEVAVSGQAAPEWREHYQTPGERKERFGKVWSGRFPGATLQQLELTGPPDRNVPVVVKSVALVPKLAEPAGPGRLRLPLSAREEDFVRSYARLSQRRHELVLAYPWQQEQELHVRFPQGWRIEQVPPARQLESGFGRFRQEVTASDDGREMTIKSTLEVTRNRISPGDYPGFRAFLATLDGAFRDTITIRKQEQAEKPR